MGHYHCDTYRKSNITSNQLISAWLTTFQAVFWIETKGKTLEEIDAIFEGEKHSTVPDVEKVRRGEETVKIEAVEESLSATKE